MPSDEHSSDHLTQLVSLTRELGEPDRELAILAEGNTSVRTADDAFVVKASGVRMHNIDADGFVEVRLEPLVDLLEGPSDVPLDRVRSRLNEVRLQSVGPLGPSIETLVHVSCLTVARARYVAHTHPTEINSLLCAEEAEQLLAGTLFPDEAVILGADALFVPYASPGLPLGIAVHERLQTFVDQHGEPPKLIYLGNHGIVTLGATPDEVRAVTEMSVKASRIRAATLSVGSPRRLHRDEVLELVGRSDEVARRAALLGSESET